MKPLLPREPTSMVSVPAASVTLGVAAKLVEPVAVAGSGDAVFDWDVVADRIYVSPEVESQLGLKRAALEGPAANWLEFMHPFDRDRFRATLDAVLLTHSALRAKLGLATTARVELIDPQTLRTQCRSPRQSAVFRERSAETAMSCRGAGRAKPCVRA